MKGLEEDTVLLVVPFLLFGEKRRIKGEFHTNTTKNKEDLNDVFVFVNV